MAGMSGKAVKIGIGVVVIAALLWFFAAGITNVSVEDFRLTGLESVTAESFTLTGELDINNPARLSVPVEKVDYVVVMNRTGEVISTGEMDSFTLEGNTVNEVPFSHEVNWVPTASLVVQMITQEHVYADLKGNVTVGVFGITDYKLPFQKSFDMKAYIRERAQQATGVDTSNVDQQVDEMGDSLDETQNGIDEISGDSGNDDSDPVGDLI